MIRAVLSDTYGTYDNLDSLLALLAGLQESGVQNPVIHCDLTERRMVVRVAAPEIAAYAPKLMENYRSPFDGTDAGNGWTPDRVRQISEREGQLMDKPEVVFAGFVFTNSETGDSAWKINPQIIIKICGNGLTITAEALKRIHIGGKMEMGVQWAKDTEEANLQLIIKKTRDAVKHYLDVDFVTRQVKELEKLAGTPVKEPAEVVADVSKKLGFSKAMSDSIFAHFIRGGQTTAGGVMQAVSSVAQVVRDGETALFMENRALQALELAAAAR